MSEIPPDPKPIREIVMYFDKDYNAVETEDEAYYIDIRKFDENGELVFTSSEINISD